MSLEACGTAQSLKPVFGELLAKDVVEEEFELLDPRSRRELAFDIPVDGENPMGGEKPESGSAALLGIRGGVRRLILPLGSPEFPRVVMRGRVIDGTRGCIEGMRGLAGIGVRMGMADIVDIDDRPTDRFGIEPIPKRADEGMVEAELEMGGCFMMIGRTEGKFRP